MNQHGSDRQGAAQQGVKQQRTCVGCRSRAARADLLRVVAVGGVIVPDPRKRLPGRGASLHPDSGCLEQAIRRRAFSRALRLEASPDSSVLLRYVQGSEET
ncbi:YlxR family protein [Actinocorallia herbida]|uniref:YlxR family protein n=1 Tax=Actinocorallia herbida TaxID=58109 RepID=UPI000F4B7EA1|nr:YlxR family protein [Actinocorallia herbida]